MELKAESSMFLGGLPLRYRLALLSFSMAAVSFVFKPDAGPYALA